MTTKTGSRIIAIEEHYAHPELTAAFKNWSQPAAIIDRLLDLNELRLREMDQAGIDVQVLSHASPATQQIDADASITLSRRINDALYETIRGNPTRFAGFGVLPTSDPKAAADELERVVTKLGFKGAMIHGLAQGRFLDEKQFWPIFERAQALDVPLYMHPTKPHQAVVDAYYKDYPVLIGAAWGFGVETATQGLRLCLSGVFDAYPRLKIILGHLGEGIPFSLWRANDVVQREGKLKKSLRQYFCEHFYITTSGNFSFPALQCCMLEMGSDRIIFSVDWPWASNTEGVHFLENCPISLDDREKMLHGNVEKLLRM
jgi:predicted TIM-barrel fold metal-dependent hydrolase